MFVILDIMFEFEFDFDAKPPKLPNSKESAIVLLLSRKNFELESSSYNFYKY